MLRQAFDDDRLIGITGLFRNRDVQFFAQILDHVRLCNQPQTHEGLAQHAAHFALGEPCSLEIAIAQETRGD